MATAQVLKVTHTVDDRVREVTDKVIDVDDRVAGVDDRVAGVDDRVKAVDEKVAMVIDGAQYIYNQPFQSNDFNLSGWKRGEASRRPSETFVISKPLSC